MQERHGGAALFLSAFTPTGVNVVVGTTQQMTATVTGNVEHRGDLERGGRQREWHDFGQRAVHGAGDRASSCASDGHGHLAERPDEVRIGDGDDDDDGGTVEHYGRGVAGGGERSQLWHAAIHGDGHRQHEYAA